MPRWWITLLLIPVLLVPPAFCRETENKDHSLPLERVIPGWVQLKSGKVLKGVLLLGGFIGTVAAAAVLNHRGNQAYDQYLASRDIVQVVELRNQTEQRFQTRNRLLVGTTAILALHFLDLKFTKKRYATITGDFSANGFRLNCRFDF
ncbi:MAG TPA: hypothetical protein ENN40_10800 [Candidatus Aminicenantes bacterium]|nr:hypothetical protein [Candidatus Aminicenantes bacterium]